ncbi:hypothetical protein Scel_17380 [Streptomyces cellostaticus]|nr:hypothetical protein Scel_17380 [Streptomyces cellostaticus]
MAVRAEGVDPDPVGHRAGLHAHIQQERAVTSATSPKARPNEPGAHRPAPPVSADERPMFACPGGGAVPLWEPEPAPGASALTASA